MTVGSNISHYSILGGNCNKTQWRTHAGQRAKTTFRLLGVSRILGRGMDVGRNRGQSNNKTWSNMASRRDEKQNINLGDRRIIWQGESCRPKRGRLGITMHKDRQTINRMVLGKINHSRFLQGRNAGTLLITPTPKSSIGVLQDYLVGDNNKLWK